MFIKFDEFFYAASNQISNKLSLVVSKPSLSLSMVLADHGQWGEP